MQRCRAAEGDHGALVELLAPFDGMDARGVRHVLVDDLGDAGRRAVRPEVEPAADMRRERRLGLLRQQL